MSVTLDEALDHLNIPVTSDDVAKVEMYMDAANEWISEKIADTSPSPVHLATLFLLQHLWETQRGPANTPLTDDDLVEVSGIGYAIPNRVLELIGPYRVKAQPTYSFPDAVAFPDPAEWPVA